MKSKRLRCFFISMIATLCVFAFVFGLLMVDYTSRWVAFGNDEPIACIVTTQDGKKEIEINVMGRKSAIDVTAGSRAAEWTEQGVRWAADALASVYSDICKTVSNL